MRFLIFDLGDCLFKNSLIACMSTVVNINIEFHQYQWRDISQNLMLASVTLFGTRVL